jgi:rare lipoprotein A
MRYINRLSLTVALPLALTACGSMGGKRDGGGRLETASAPVAAPAGSVSDGVIKVGEAYVIDGKSYTPEDVPAYDEVGYASWYGEEFSGRNTANGEAYVASAITGAHKTLPLPSYVEVTALDTGKTILVRLNDRGPFANDRLIDLSAGAARELGIQGQGVAGVRVRKVNPPEQDRAMLRTGVAAPARMDTPESLLKVLREKLGKLPRPTGARVAPVIASNPSNLPSTAGSGDRYVREGAAPARVVQPAPPRAVQPPVGGGRYVREGNGPTRSAAPAVTVDGRFIREGAGYASAASASGFVVQVASFSSRSRAEDLARRLGASVAASADGGLFRVRYGPYATEAEGQRALAAAQQRGYPQARLFRE